MLAVLTISFRVPGRRVAYEWFEKRLGDVLLRAVGEECVGEEGGEEGVVIFWALVVGLVTVIEGGEEWVGRVWVKVRKGVGDWELAKECLGRVLWISHLLDGEGEEVLKGLERMFLRE